jgi:hypothetical protein
METRYFAIGQQMNYQDTIISRKASRRAFISGMAMCFVVLLALLSILLSTRFPNASFWYEAVLLPAIIGSIMFSAIGGIAGTLAASRPTVASGVLFSGLYCSLFGLFALAYADKHEFQTYMMTYLLCFSACATIGVICGGVGAVFARTCRETEGKRFWPQYSLAELMTVMVLFAVLLSCIVTLRNIIAD